MFLVFIKININDTFYILINISLIHDYDSSMLLNTLTKCGKDEIYITVKKEFDLHGIFVNHISVWLNILLYVLKLVFWDNCEFP